MNVQTPSLTHIEYQDCSYDWTGHAWINGRTRQPAPAALNDRLHGLARHQAQQQWKDRYARRTS